MPSLPVSIVRFVDETQPGIVECEFTDAYQRVHKLVDKIPIFSERDLWKDSQYPQPGEVECRVDEVFSDILGRELARIAIGAQMNLVDGATDFVVERSQVIDDPAS